MQTQLPLFSGETRLINTMLSYIEHKFRYYLHNGNPIYCHSLTDRNSYRFILGNLVSNHLCSITELSEALGERRKNIERYAKTFRDKGTSHFFSRKETRGQCYKLTYSLYLYLALPNMSVRLQLTVKANGFTLTTRDYAAMPSIIVEPNVPYRLSQEELSNYFDSRNLRAEGMGISAWQRERKLPEGLVEFCFEMFDRNTGRKLSLPGCGMAYIAARKPSTLNLPTNNALIKHAEPLNLLFRDAK
jgi:hypothetical protein